MIRWVRFNAVGILGAGIQLAVLWLMLRLRVNYLVATAIALETAVLHNYVWHRLWTWRGQPGSLWRFHLSNGLGALVCNLALMRLFTGSMGFKPIPSNLAAIILTSFLNFALASKWVFLPSKSPGYPREVRRGL
jgi:putative flippase GtrA